MAEIENRRVLVCFEGEMEVVAAEELAFQVLWTLVVAALLCGVVNQLRIMLENLRDVVQESRCAAALDCLNEFGSVACIVLMAYTKSCSEQGGVAVRWKSVQCWLSRLELLNREDF